MGLILDQESTIASGLLGLVKYQAEISGRVPGALDGTREATTLYAYGLCEEIHETVREIGWKPWKTASPPDVDRVVEEYADILAFLGILTINLAKACGLPPEEFIADVALQYQSTSSKNYARFANGQEPT